MMDYFSRSDYREYHMMGESGYISSSGDNRVCEYETCLSLVPCFSM